MSDKTLGNARGLNSIADPKKFKGSAGRAKLTRRGPAPADAPDIGAGAEPATEPAAETAAAVTGTAATARARAERTANGRAPSPEADRLPDDDGHPGNGQRDDGHHATPAGSANGATGATTQPAPAPPSAATSTPAPHRAVQPGVQRKRRELSIPHQVAEALEATGINPADVVMAGYRNHGDAIYAGAGGRMAAKGRTRLRLSISDTEFEQITRLGLARGWNRSETVSVILALELETSAAVG